MFTGKQFGVLGLVTGANLLLSLLVSTIGGSLGAQGPTGQTGPQGPQGSTGEAGEIGADGREVEFQVEGNVLQWRYIGDTEWQVLDLEISGGNSTVNTGGNNLYSHWVFNNTPALRFDYRSRISVDNAATYAAGLIANEGYVGVASLADLQAIDDTPEALAGKYVLTSNIDLTTFTPDIPNNSYNVVTGTFTGILDGATYTISNYNINTTDAGNNISDAGIFYQLEGATIQNLILNNFNYTSPNEIYNSGALAGTTNNNNNEKVIIDQVYADNLTFKGTNRITQVGGLIGEINSDTAFIRTQVANAQFQSDSTIYGSGGMYGWVDGSYDLEIYESSIQLNVGPVTEGVKPDTDRVGGTAGNHQSNSTLLAYKVTSNLTGKVDSHSAGFIGNIAGYSKVIIQDLTVQAELTQLNAYNGNNNGGVFGFYGRDGILIMDDVEVNGTIEGNNDIGGFIGYAKEGSIIRIANSTNNADINGDQGLGGLIGRLNLNRHKWIFENVTVNSTISLKEISGESSQYGNAYGGLIGVVEDRDNDVLEDTNQIMIKDADINVAYELSMGTLENIENRYYELDSMGGMIGDLGQDNDVRISNSSVVMTLDLSGTVPSKIDTFNIYLYDIGGLIGYTEDSSVLALNVDTDVALTVNLENFAPESTNQRNADFSVYDVGGLFGEVDSGQVTVVAGTSNLSLDYSIENFTSNFHNYDISFESTGGLVGQLDSDALMLIEELDVTYEVNFSILNVTVADGNTMNILVEEIGTLIGDASGVAFLTGLTYTSSITQVLPEEDNTKIFLDLNAMNNPIGTINPFIFIQE
jgi:hypothetical protein